ncbi:N-acyl-L-amino acid amidohydrolase [Oceanobacillus iheyensis HTE831]|uniref:N-acyl-L-amino acid amidohydrolase n=1 Tax=Oceanobacillus iheyensis (strain DSM 14371 / CIP 107618 / JCM 11309 / KCTC 3954 / HTE831) TaxID=221109 RepID=Q8EMA9_OCEIH|nr:amidohydrolase [Oceanobacillus iheyensis]BAC14904.1 N-acyl-L-amino acid amidohydrolase [Oceanobacillus iheyensis HTE831]
MSVYRKVLEYEDQLIEWRREFHRFPELSFEEFHTSKRIVEILQTMNHIQIEKGLGTPTSVIATITTGEGPVVALRADMDALPIQEQTHTPYESQNPGVMHACGHDAHTAILLGAAKVISVLAQSKAWEGTIKLIFQPAEEAQDEHGLSGSPYLLQAGVYDQVEAAFALHMCPWKKTGQLLINDGFSMASVDEFEATIYATGGHGGYPEKSTDPIWMLSLVLPGLYGIISRRIAAAEKGVISVGEIQAGNATNIIPAKASIRGTIRSYTPTIRDQLERELHQVFQMVHSLGGEYRLNVSRGEPALYNDPYLNQIVRHSVRKIQTHIDLFEDNFGMGGEDFGYVSQKLPATMFFLGCALEEDYSRDLHTPVFDIDESSLVLGVTILVESALARLKQATI